MSDEQHKPCPWCLGTTLRRNSFFNGLVYVTAVECKGCGARGPTGDSVMAGGWEPWNTRPAVLDIGNPKANIYGCLPCPKCGSEFRVPYDRVERVEIDCDCGFVQPAVRQA
jgi:hypothetical protein